MTVRKCLFFVLCLCWLTMVTMGNKQETCSDTTPEDGTCQSLAATPTTPRTTERARTKSIRFFSETSYCTSSANDIYQHGGSAQAYRPNGSISSTVCPHSMAQEFPYKVSTWPVTRHTKRRGTAPTLDVTLHLWSCRSKDKDDKVSACTCSPLKDVDVADNHIVTKANGSAQIWQTRPDGRYPSLRGDDLGECRATVPLNDQGDVEFTTVAPGSTGVMGGLGPRGWESAPYGPPVLHILVQVPNHLPLLVDLPILPHQNTLEERSFSFASLDWRGLSWSKGTQEKNYEPFKIKSWTPNKEDNRIDVKVTVFLELASSGDHENAAAVTAAVEPDFCPSWYFLPRSFFLEPIAVCARHLLDFFQL